jgi:hypothetical protein
MQRLRACQAKLSQERKDVGRSEKRVFEAMGTQRFYVEFAIRLALRADFYPDCRGCRVTGIPTATPKEALDHLSPYGYTPMHASVARKHLSPTSKGDGRNENHRLERKPQG